MTTENLNFKTQGVGIDLSTVSLPLSNLLFNGTEINYFNTSIESNNDFLLRDIVEYYKGVSLITSIDFIDSPLKLILGHLSSLGRDKIDLLLVNEKALLDNIDNIKNIINSLIESGVVDNIGIKNPTSIDNIKSIQSKLGNPIKYVSLDICPLHFNYETIDYCINEKISILGFNPFGGHLSSAGLIESFTKQYLLNFISVYSDVVFLSGRDIVNSIENANYITEQIINKTIPGSKYVLKKSVSKLYKPLKKVINTSVKFNDNLVLSFNNPESLLYTNEEVITSFGKPASIINVDSKLRTTIETEVIDIMNSTEFPKNCSNNCKLSLARYQVLEILESKFSKDSEWNIKVVGLDSKSVAIIINRNTQKRKKWYSLKKENEKESNVFLLSVSDSGEIIFIENPDLKNTSTIN